jgi:aerobic carbon-monoxide dehydrogenase small subunit
MRIALSVNGSAFSGDVDPELLLVEFLRNQLELIGTRVGCNNGICGSCTILVDREPIRACLMLAVQADQASITTIEGLIGDPLQDAFVERGAVQCGFCIPGMIMAARGLLDRTPDASTEDIVAALDGNLCRCTGYVKIVEAAAAAARSS